MSENQPEPILPAAPVSAESSLPVVPVPPETRTAETSLSEEFRQLGNNLYALLQALRETRQAKEIEAEVTQAFREVEHQVDEAMSTARQRLRDENLKDTLKGAAQTASDETVRGLARGLRLVNDRMARMVQESETSTGPKPRSGRIEIESVPPAQPNETQGEKPNAER